MSIRIVPCTQQKVWDDEPRRGPTPAESAYTYWAFPEWRTWARQGSRWFVLSSKYGLLAPNDLIEKYDVPVGRVEEDDAFAAKVARQARDLGFAKGTTVQVADWDRFERLARRAFAPLDLSVELVRVTGRF